VMTTDATCWKTLM